MRVVELFAGIGGASAAFPAGAHVVAAVDQNPYAERQYRAWFPGHPWLSRNLAGTVRLPAADLWWMSPPCQPYTVRGAQRDLDDARARSLVRVLGTLREVRPTWVAMENVAPFARSRARALVVESLEGAGYEVRERVLCPTELGIPAERPRYYLVAGREPLLTPPEVERARVRLRDLLDPDAPAGFDVPAELRERYRHALHVVDGDDDHAVAATFTSAYGRSPVYAGSYLRWQGRLRRFTPDELLRLLGFPGDLHLLDDLPLQRRYGLVGNSLSVVAVREVLRAIPPP